MGTSLIDNFSYKGKGFLDARQSVATLAALRAVPATDIPDGFRAYCAETAQWYEYNSSNAEDPATGRWRHVDSKMLEKLDNNKQAISDCEAQSRSLAESHKETEEAGVFLANDAGEVFASFTEEGFDTVPSEALKEKIISGISREVISSTEEDGAFFTNENGEVFASFVNGHFKAVGLEIPDAGAASGSGNTVIVENSVKNLSDLSDVTVSPSEGSVLVFRGGKWVDAAIDLSGTVTSNSRVSHPLYGKHVWILGDSHSAIPGFYDKIAELSGCIMHKLATSKVEGSTHLFIDGMDKGVFPGAFPYDWAAYVEAVRQAALTMDYVIVENCHFGNKDKWADAKSCYPFAGFTCVDFPVKFNSYQALNNHLSNWASAVAQAGVTGPKKAIRCQYLASAAQKIVFSFTSGSVLAEDCTVEIRFSASGNPISTNLTAGMTLQECVSAINDWAFQEFSDWTNSDKGITGLTQISLTYSGGDSGDPDALAIVTTASNLAAIVTEDVKYSEMYYVYALPDDAGINIRANWVSHGSSAIGWFFPQPLMGAMDLIGRYYPMAKVVFCGIGNYSTSETDAFYPDGTANAGNILGTPGVQLGQEAKEISRMFAGDFGCQYIDVDGLCGITPFNMYPTFYSYNNVHLKPAGYEMWAKCIVNNIK